MITLRPGDKRGRTKMDWLDSWHTFSFDRYYDPNHMGFRSLRVMNEDWIVPGRGFGTHPHREMEIITYVLEGSVIHRDSTGSHTEIVPGEVQRMSAGAGISHSEFNGSQTLPLHLLQIWILPGERGLKPGYEQKAFSPSLRENQWCLVAAREPRAGAITVHQDVELLVTSLSAGATISHCLADGRHAWVQLARGAIKLNGAPMAAGDGAAVSAEHELAIEAIEPAEILLFDLA